jgi:hypothetical protein
VHPNILPIAHIFIRNGKKKVFKLSACEGLMVIVSKFKGRRTTQNQLYIFELIVNNLGRNSYILNSLGFVDKNNFGIAKQGFDLAWYWDWLIAV